MKPFLSPKESKRKAFARARALNPCPGRSQKQYQRITRAIRAIQRRIYINLACTDYKPLRWLPYSGVVGATDDEWQHDLYAQVQEGTYTLNDNGFMADWFDPGLKATNRIVSITWYENSDNDGFIIKKPVLSPLPCDDWGRLPLTGAQWWVIAMTLIESEQLWRWTHAVREYTNDKSFEPVGIAGWYMEPTQHVVSHRKLADDGKGFYIDAGFNDEQKQDRDGWVGQNLYPDIIDAFLRAESEG